MFTPSAFGTELFAGATDVTVRVVTRDRTPHTTVEQKCIECPQRTLSRGCDADAIRG